MPAILDWRASSGSDELIRQIVGDLAGGAIVALPTEAGVVLAIDPDRLSDPSRLQGLPDSVSTYRLDGYPDAADFFAQAPPTPSERVLASRLWPGPIGWVHDESPYPAWVPSHLAIATVLAARRAPLALFELDGGQPVDETLLGTVAATIVTDGTPRPGPVTLIRPSDVRWSVIRPGIVSEADIQRTLARHIVFVCTGNTCRSPMAEGLFKQRLAERIGCSVDELPGRGYVIASAGIAASSFAPATSESIAIVRDFGVDLSGHRSRPATAELIARADDVIAMTRTHLATLVGRFPILGGALRLLGGVDGDLDDPIGGGPDVYQKCATAIRNHVDRLITEMGLS